MKRYLIFLLCILCLVSCQKETDGVYRPKQRISCIYRSDIVITVHHADTFTTLTPRYLSERWTWSHRRLERIDYHNSNGDINYTESYTYDGRRLQRVDFSHPAGDSYVTYAYDGQKVSQMDFYDDYGDRVAICSFEYSDGLLSQMQIVPMAADKKSLSLLRIPVVAPLSSLPAFDTVIFRLAKNSLHTKGKNDACTYSFEWSGGNISSMQCCDARGRCQASYDFGYDQYSNPYYRMLPDEAEADPACCSVNNLVSETCTLFDEEGSRSTSREYSYQYNRKGYPAQRFAVTSASNGLTSYLATTITEFQYE